MSGRGPHWSYNRRTDIGPRRRGAGRIVGSRPFNSAGARGTVEPPSAQQRDRKRTGSRVSIKRTIREAKFAVGQIVRHRHFPFRGVIYDVDPEFNHTDEWYESIPPDRRPSKDQPFYHLLAQNSEGPYEAYVSEQNLLP